MEISQKYNLLQKMMDTNTSALDEFIMQDRAKEIMQLLVDVTSKAGDEDVPTLMEKIYENEPAYNAYDEMKGTNLTQHVNYQKNMDFKGLDEMRSTNLTKATECQDVEELINIQPGETPIVLSGMKGINLTLDDDGESAVYLYREHIGEFEEKGNTTLLMCRKLNFIGQDKSDSDPEFLENDDGDDQFKQTTQDDWEAISKANLQALNQSQTKPDDWEAISKANLQALNQSSQMKPEEYYY